MATAAVSASGAVDRLFIPVVDSNEVVAININDLPQNADDLLEILIAEAAPLSTWFDCARAYLAIGRHDAFEAIFDTATAKETAAEVEKYFGRKPTYEQIQFFCAKAFLLMARAKDEPKADRRQGLLNDARILITQASGLNPNEQLVVLTSALHSLAKGDTATAMRELHRAANTLTCKNDGKVNVIGLVALASVLYGQGKYKEALAHYRQALREHPACPAEVRLGIAACSLKLGDLATAKAAYTRAATLDPACADALLGLAIVAFSSSNVQQGLADGLKLLMRAYAVDPMHVGVLTQLAHYSLMGGMPEKTLRLAHAALEGADNDALRAELTTLLARAYHATGQFDKARGEYAKAAAMDMRLPLPRLGVAQMYCAAGQLVNAATELEEALKSSPGFTDALKILGHLLPALMRDTATTATSGREGGAAAGSNARLSTTVSLLKDATQRRQDDAELWEMLGELTCGPDPAGSLAAYKRALDVHEAKQAAVVAERKRIQERNEKMRADLVERIAAEREARRAAAIAAAAAKRAKAAKAAKRKQRQEERDAEDGIHIDDDDDLFGSDDDDDDDVGGNANGVDADGDVDMDPAAWVDEEFEAEAKAEEAALVQDLEDPAVAVPDHHTPAKLLNNAAVLYYRAGDSATALALVKRAMRSGEVEIQGGAVASDSAYTMAASAQGVTMAFNHARLAEAFGDTKTARKGYEELLAAHPMYTDCRLRLACIAHSTGNYSEALSHAQAALETEQKNAAANGAAKPTQPPGLGPTPSSSVYSEAMMDALALLSQLYMEKRDYERANNHLVKMIHANKKDSYGHIGYANTLLYTAPRNVKGEEAQRKAEERYTKALEEYVRVLSSEPRNVWAANGLGASLAELGHLDPARQIFQEVYTSIATAGGFLQVPDVHINLANVHLARQEYADAIHMYRVALKELPHKHHPLVLLYLARAYYDSDQLPKAQATLARAAHLAPTDYKLRFNFALTLQEWAVRTFRRKRPPSDPTKYKEFSRASQCIKDAHRYFEHLKALGRERSGLDDTKLDAHVKFCAEMQGKAQELLDNAQVEQYNLELRKHEQLKLKEAAEMERRAAEMQRKAEEEQTRRAREEAARLAYERLEAKKAEWRQQRAMLEGNEADMDAGGDAGGGGRKRGRKGEGKKGGKGGGGGRDKRGGSAGEDEEALFGGGSGPGEEEEEYEDAMRAAGLESDDDEEGGAAPQDEEDEEGQGAAGRKRKRQRLRPKAGAAGDDDEDAGIEDGVEDDDAAGLADVDDVEDGDGGAGPRDADADEDLRAAGLQDSDEEDQEAAPSQPSAQKKRSRRAALEDDDEDEDGGNAQEDQDAAPAAGDDDGGAAEEEGDGGEQYGDLFGEDEE